MNRIPMSFFQACSVVLFLLTLFSPGLSRWLISLDMPPLLILYSILLMLLNPIVFLGYFRLAREQGQNELARSSLVLAITLFAVITANVVLLWHFSPDEMTGNPVLGIPNIILGGVTIYFGLCLFKAGKCNGKNAVYFGIFSMVTGALLMSFVLYPLTFVARWFFYGAASYYLFRRMGSPGASAP